MGNENEIKGIQQYREAIARAFGSKNEIFRTPPDVFVTSSLDTLRETPVDDVFYGKKPNYYNIPRAIALTHDDASYFEPLIVISDQRLQNEGPYRNYFIRENAVCALGGSLIEISHGSSHKGYQAVHSCRGIEKTGIPRKERRNLIDWLGKISSLTDVFRSREFQEMEEKYWKEGQLLGKGFAKMAEEQNAQRRGG
ncbi:MAG: hypothetical protein Q8N88_03100 [Nanoarchaeota archaeon]|nr:hypothetical protein [Nanoarchaeota archaeon]